MDAVVWIPIVGAETLYEISNLGSVRRLVNRGKFKANSLMTGSLNDDGYVVVNLNGKVDKVHRIVAKHFIANPEHKPEINHIDGIKTNNAVSNLEWCNRSENLSHAYNYKLRVPHKGIDRPNAKLNDIKVINIRHCKGSMSYKRLGQIFNVSESAISHVMNYHNWRHV